VKQVPSVEQATFVRVVALDDIHRRKSGTGRTVEAYCAVFNEPAEVRDQDGHYREQNDPASFNRTIQHRGGRFPVIYNHGLSLLGTPSDRGTVPIGVSTSIRADSKGVLTISEYGRSELADEVLEMIDLGAITGQSYGGRYLRSTPPLRPGQRYRADGRGELPLVTRLEVAMHEFGPTPMPAFAGASIVGIRAQLLDELRRQYDGIATPSEDPADPHGTPDPGPAGKTEDSRQHSVRSLPLADRIRAAKIARGMD
jgi:phage head maturation protease